LAVGRGNTPALIWRFSSAWMLVSSIVAPSLVEAGVMVVCPPKLPRPISWLVPGFPLEA